MRLLYVTSQYPHGVGEGFLTDEVNAFLDAGWKVDILALNPQGRENQHRRLRLSSPGLSVLHFPLFTPVQIFAIPRGVITSPTAAIRSLRLFATEGRFAHRIKNLVAWNKATSLIPVLRGVDYTHIHAHWAATSATLAMCLAEMLRLPWSFTMHRWDIVDANLIREKIKSCAFCRCISQGSVDLLLAHNSGCDVGKVKIVPMGVSLEGISATQSVGRCGKVVICPANLIPVKGHRYLIEAIALLPENVALWIVGEGPLRSELERHARICSVIDRVRFLGRLDQAELFELYRSPEIGCVCLPSIDLGNGEHEGIPVSLMEAMAFGIPVVSTRTGSIPELLEGVGELVPPENPQALAESIARSLSSDRDLSTVQQLQSARSRVLDTFSAHRSVRLLSNLFRDENSDQAVTLHGPSELGVSQGLPNHLSRGQP